MLAQLSENKKYYTTFITELKPVDPGFNKNFPPLNTYLRTITESSQKRDVVWKLSILVVVALTLGSLWKISEM